GPRAHRAGAREPAGQRRQVHRARRRARGARAVERPRLVRGARHRTRHPRERPAAGVRALLSRGQDALAREGRNRARALDREARDRAPRRRGLGDEPPRPGDDGPLRAAAGRVELTLLALPENAGTTSSTAPDPARRRVLRPASGTFHATETSRLCAW